MIRLATISSLFLLISITLTAQSVSFHDHGKYDALLKKYVNREGSVDYVGLKKEKNTLLDYIKNLKENPVHTTWSRDNQLAYWINLYNALTLELIINNYPLKSITDIEKAWDIPLITISGRPYTLNNIENDVIRPEYKEPRIHFAVNCAAKSCPKLLNEAFTGIKLNAQLEKQTKAFINNTSYNKISPHLTQVSKIFEWYAADFGSLTSYLNKYSNTKINSNTQVTYMEYNWHINKQ